MRLCVNKVVSTVALLSLLVTSTAQANVCSDILGEQGLVNRSEFVRDFKETLRPITDQGIRLNINELSRAKIYRATFFPSSKRQGRLSQLLRVAKKVESPKEYLVLFKDGSERFANVTDGVLLFDPVTKKTVESIAGYLEFADGRRLEAKIGDEYEAYPFELRWLGHRDAMKNLRLSSEAPNGGISLRDFVDEFYVAVSKLISQNVYLDSRKLERSSVVVARSEKNGKGYMVLLTPNAARFPDHTGSIFIFNIETKALEEPLGELKLFDGRRLQAKMGDEYDGDPYELRWLGQR